ncbi:hypothetical protein TNCV_1790711 [Trichonephila clavipes]|nr:hypothetical protein TNCV_1790711 [Trichonephila clavipes]
MKWRSVVLSSDSRFCLCASGPYCLEGGQKHPGVSLVIQPAALPLRYNIQVAVFQWDNTAVITQKTLQIDVLSLPARSPDLSPNSSIATKYRQKLVKYRYWCHEHDKKETNNTISIQ